MVKSKIITIALIILIYNTELVFSTTNSLFKLRPKLGEKGMIYRIEDVMQFKGHKGPREEFKILRLDKNNYNDYRLRIVDILRELPGATESLIGAAFFITGRSITEKVIVYVALIEGEAMGYILASLRDSGEIDIFSIGVMPGMQNRGIGNTLLWLAAEKAKDMGVSIIGASVHYSNEETRIFFSSRGFEEIWPEDLREGYKPVVIDLKGDVSLVIEKTLKKMKEDSLEQVQNSTSREPQMAL